MIIAGTYTDVWIDLGNDQPSLILQHKKRGDRWRDYMMDGKVVKSSVDLAKLQPRRYRLVD